MQLIWVAGPAGQIVRVSITRRTVAWGVAVLASGLVVLGFVFQWIGLRVAIEHVPELAQRLGGVTSQSEQDKMEAIYQAKLDTLNQQMAQVQARLKALEATKNEVLGRVGLDKLLSLSTPVHPDGVRGQGGPLNLVSPGRLSHWSLEQQFDRSLAQAQRYQQSMAYLQSQWAHDLSRLDSVPTLLPLAGEFWLTSSYGFRMDPFTRLPSLHDGLDFVAPVGTPILATAGGQVLRAEYAGAYGHLVELAHGNGLVTRYAHLKSIAVSPGERLEPQAVVGHLGNTGRSTGPHLHYEVLYQGRSMHPIQALAAWAQNSTTSFVLGKHHVHEEKKSQHATGFAP